jgi:hypothetical protein
MLQDITASCSPDLTAMNLGIFLVVIHEVRIFQSPLSRNIDLKKSLQLLQGSNCDKKLNIAGL